MKTMTTAMKDTSKGMISRILIIVLTLAIMITAGTGHSFAASGSIGNVMFSKSDYSYSGSAQGPNVTVYDDYGRKLSSQYYVVNGVTKSTGCGTYFVTVKGRNGYTGEISCGWQIHIGAMKAPQVSLNKKKATVTVNLPKCKTAYVYIYKNGVQQKTRKVYKNTSGVKKITYKNLAKGKYRIQVVAYAPVSNYSDASAQSSVDAYSEHFVVG